jgi:selenocysteine lyase/cysteine desulfurase
LAYELRNEIGLDFIDKKEEELKQYFYKSIKGIEDIEMYCKEEHDKIAIFSFNIK